MNYSFGTWVRRRRKALDLTQQQLTQRVGCSTAMLVKIEGDERRPSRQIAELLLKYLEIPNEHHELFLKVARQEKVADVLEQLPPVGGSELAPVISHTRVALPVPPTIFIGREHELTMILNQIEQPQCQILTLTGPGGVGKTRLALEVAQRIQDKFKDGVFFISLAGVANPEYVVFATADALGIHFSGSLDPKTQVFNFLRNKTILLLFDNLEHLLHDGANSQLATEFISELLQRVSHAKVITTSREQLKLQAEWVIEIQGLPLPRTAQINEIESNSAAKLFIQRAQQSRLGITWTDRDYADVMRICQLVEGLPLGIELAAAWVRTLSCDEIVKEIKRGLGILSADVRDIPERHRSIRTVFDYSWKLLSPDEQAVFMQLSVFRGGFTRRAAEAVAGASLIQLSSLVTKSLVRHSGTSRYDLHELIRQYAFEELDKQAEFRDDVRVRHGQYFIEFLSQQDRRLRSSEQRNSIDELTEDIDNIREAQNWALTHGKFALIETTLRAYSTLFDTLGWVQEALDFLGRVKDVLEQQPALPAREEQIALAHVLTSRSLFAYRAAQQELGKAMLNRSLEILRPLDEPRVLVEALTLLGILTLTAGDLAGALELFKEGLQVARDSKDDWY